MIIVALPCCVAAAEFQEIILRYSLLKLIASRQADAISDVSLSEVGFILVMMDESNHGTET